MTSDGQATRVELKAPYLIFLGDEPEQTHAKTGIGIAHWRPELCVGQKRLPGCGVDLGLPDLSPAEAYAAGARSIIWGVAGVPEGAQGLELLHVHRLRLNEILDVGRRAGEEMNPGLALVEEAPEVAGAVAREGLQRVPGFPDGDRALDL